MWWDFNKKLMTILEFKKTHLIITPNFFTTSDLHGVFNIDVSKKISKEIHILKDLYKNKWNFNYVIINIPLAKIVYYIYDNDMLIDVDDYLEQFKTDKFNLFYNIGLSIPDRNLIALYDVDDVIIYFKYKSTRKSTSGGKSFYKNLIFFNKKIYLKTSDTKKREYKLEKLLEGFE